MNLDFELSMPKIPKTKEEVKFTSNFLNIAILINKNFYSVLKYVFFKHFLNPTDILSKENVSSDTCQKTKNKKKRKKMQDLSMYQLDQSFFNDKLIN